MVFYDEYTIRSRESCHALWPGPRSHQVESRTHANSNTHSHNVFTRFTGGQRKTVNQEGRAMGEAVWAKFSGGCSVRILRPQEYSDK
eukprot:395317-Amorphochlora_amoeboformis.AAC.1